MTEHEVCKGCQHNKYPICEGTTMEDKTKMNIENLHEEFDCGVKNMPNGVDLSFKLLTKDEELEAEIENLKARITELESKEVK
jgi:hypothetical protein